MATTPRQIREYLTENGMSPFAEWLHNLKDRQARAKIRVRLDRLALGNPGDIKSLGSSLAELRIDYGPGYRVYFGQEGESIVLLLCGGAKKTQHKDILLAHTYWQDYKRRSQ